MGVGRQGATVAGLDRAVHPRPAEAQFPGGEPGEAVDGAVLDLMITSSIPRPGGGRSRQGARAGQCFEKGRVTPPLQGVMVRPAAGRIGEWTGLDPSACFGVSLFGHEIVGYKGHGLVRERVLHLR